MLLVSPRDRARSMWPIRNVHDPSKSLCMWPTVVNLKHAYEFKIMMQPRILDSRHYSLFTYSGSSNFFWFLLHNESLRRNCFVQFMWCASTFWKCVWFENIGSIPKVMIVEVENVTWRFVHFFHLDSSDGVLEESLPISTLSCSRTVSCNPSSFYALSHSLSKCWHPFCHARGWQTNDISHAAFMQARPNGAKIVAPRWCHVRAKSFPCN